MLVELLASMALAGGQERPRPPVPPIVHGIVWFEPGATTPLPQRLDVIDYLAPRIPADAYVYVMGKTDTAGTEAYNDGLARARARAVAELLVERGVAPERIALMICGERLLNRPTADGVAEPLNRSAYFDWRRTPVEPSSDCPVEVYER